MGERESLYRNFFSLGDVVQMVANCIYVADGEFGQVVQPQEGQDDATVFKARVAATSRSQLIRTSRAAEVLGVSIANTPAGHRLRWLDLARGAGDVYWQSVDASTEGLALLSDMAKWERVAREERHWQDRLIGSRWSTPQSEPAPQFIDLPKIPRIRLIGFAPDELIDFLLTQRIPNTLVAALPIVDPEIIKTPNSTPVQPRVDEPPKFRGLWAEVLVRAWEAARDRNSAHSVLYALANLAKQDPPPIPLTGASDDGREVYWKDHNGKTRSFTIDDMQSRMRTIRKSHT